jgi:hypothetical protein
VLVVNEIMLSKLGMTREMSFSKDSLKEEEESIF